MSSSSTTPAGRPAVQPEIADKPLSGVDQRSLLEGDPMDRRQEDLEHLKLLSIFYYIVAGLAALFACLPIIHLVMGIFMFTESADFGDQSPMPQMMGCFFIAMSLVFILGGWAFAACCVMTGKYLSQQRRYTFCLVMAGVACIFMPFGTVLGVFTIVVLVRDSVKELFEDVGPAQDAAGRI